MRTLDDYRTERDETARAAYDAALDCLALQWRGDDYADQRAIATTLIAEARSAQSDYNHALARDVRCNHDA